MLSNPPASEEDVALEKIISRAREFTSIIDIGPETVINGDGGMDLEDIVIFIDQCGSDLGIEHATLDVSEYIGGTLRPLAVIRSVVSGVILPFGKRQTRRKVGPVWKQLTPAETLRLLRSCS